MKRIPGRLGLVAALIVAAGAQVVTQLATAAPAAAIPQMVTAIAFSSTDAAPVKAAVAQCPAGDATIGGGGVIYDYDANQVHLIESWPTSTTNLSTQWRAVGAAQPGFTGNWNIKAYAICAPPPPQYTLGLTTAPRGYWPYKTHGLGATCGAGLTMLSAGFMAFAPDNSTDPRNLGVASMLLDAPDSVTLWAHTKQNDGGNWGLNLFTICAQLPGHTIADTWVSGSGGVVYCPSGTKVHGVFGGTRDDTGDAFLSTMFPGNLALQDAVTYLTTTPSTGQTRLQAVCAP